MESNGLIIDTHGASVIDPVWALLDATYARIGGNVPTCLERNFQIPSLPVHRIGLAYRPRKPQPTQLLVWRDAHDMVQFIQLNAVSARLLTLLAAAPTTGAAVCCQIADELRHPEPELIVSHGAALLRQWQAQGVVLGVATTGLRVLTPYRSFSLSRTAL